jgi:pimeloyl-ACP methyl ester carboxylesterase
VHYNLDDALKMRRIYDNNMTRDLSVAQEIEIIHATFKVIDGSYITDFDKAGLGEAYFNNLKGLKLLNPDMLDLSSLIMNLAKIPTLLLHGEHSDLLTNDIAQDTLAILEYGHYAKIKNRGHIPLLTESDSISAIDNFLDL